MSKEKDEPLVFIPLPLDLEIKVKSLMFRGKIDNPSDLRVLELTLAYPEEITEAAIIWMELLVQRGGNRYVKD